MALQLHLRLALSFSEVEEREGLVWISRARMAESRSLMVEELPCIDVPPERLILVLGAGEDVRDVLTFGRSETREPAADGGGFGDPFRDDARLLEVDLTGGSCRASGLSERARVFANCVSWRLPDI